MKPVVLALVVAVGLACSLVVPASAQPAADPRDAIAKAYVVVDADTGNVVSAYNERVALPPASITKLLTALTVLSRMKPTDEITIATTNPESMPALKVGVKQGETWTVDRLLHALLMVSANDAAVALAEGASGTLDDFALARAQAAHDLGLSDSFAFNDPAGLDDAEWGHNGGDLVSARDMAIVARAALANDEIRSIVASSRHDFTGLDGRPHHFLNHNGFLKSYAGALGMKTGSTRKAGKTFVAAAQRDGRTMIAVLLNTNNMYVNAGQLLDQGFATPMSAESTSRQLTASSVKMVAQELPAASSAITAATPATGPDAFSELSDGDALVPFLAVSFVVVLILLTLHHFRRPLWQRYVYRRVTEFD